MGIAPEPPATGAVSRFLANDHVRLDVPLARLRAAPEVPVHRHTDGSKIIEVTHRTLIRAKYESLAATLEG